MPDVVNVPGFQWAQRFRVISTFDNSPATHQYFAVYGIAAGELDSTHTALFGQLAKNAEAKAASLPEPMPISTSLDRDIPGGWYNLITAGA